MTLQQLRYFAALARTRSFRSAAKQLSVSQPTLSQQIGVLERELGVKLIDRRRNNVAVTEFGDRVLHFAHLMLADETAIIDESQAYRQITSLRVGCICGAMTLLLGHGLTEFRSRHPTVRLSIHEAGSIQLVHTVLRGELDFGIVADDGTLHTLGRFRREQIIASELVLCQPRGPSLSPSGMMPLISLPEGYLLNHIMRAYMNRSPSQTVIYTSSAEAALNLVMEGAGATILPLYLLERVAPSEIGRMSVSPLVDDVPDTWRWVLMWKHDRPLSASDRAFIAAVTNQPADERGTPQSTVPKGSEDGVLARRPSRLTATGSTRRSSV